MKKALLFFMLCGICMYGYSQEENFYNPIETVAKVPQSPEVAAFEKFSADINMYTGTPNISIPLYTFQGKELSLPVSLSYDASGVKVEQIATNIGLSWSLNYGGIISRNVNGQPDDFIGGVPPDKPENRLTHANTRNRLKSIDASGFIHGTHQNETIDGQNVNASTIASHAFDFYWQYQDNNVDYQSDTFSVNVNGLSGTIVIDYWDNSGAGDYKAYFLEDPLVEVEYILGDGIGAGFTITNASGVVYKFQAFETTEHTTSKGGDFDPEFTYEYITAWYLTEMSSANGLDSFTFSYTGETWNDVRELYPVQQKELTYLSGCNSGTDQISTIKERGFNEYKKTQLRLDGITYNSAGVSVASMSTTPASRTDLAGVSRISKLEFYSLGNLVFKVDLLNNSYFGGNRLKLDGIDIYRNSASDAKSYVFEYDRPSQVPPRIGEFGVDFWGYYNGKSNDDFVPNCSSSYNSNVAGFFTDLGSYSNTQDLADRRPNLDKTKIGSLESITYPTGGKTTYNYEQHRDGDLKIVGGLRIQSVITSSEDQHNGGTSSYETFYYYNDLKAVIQGGGSIPSASSWPTSYPSDSRVQQDIYFTDFKFIDVPDPSEDCDYKRYYVSQNRAPIVPSPITYSSVSQIRYNNGVFEGCTVTHFNNGTYTGGQGIAERQMPFVNVNLDYGSVNKQSVYSSNLTLLQETLTTTTTELANTTLPSLFGLTIYQSGPNNATGGNGFCQRYETSGSGFHFSLAQTLPAGTGNSCPGGYLPANNPNDPSDVNFAHYNNTTGYTYQQRWVKSESTTTRSYELGLLMETVTTNTYGSTNHYMPTEVTTTDSKGGVNKFETVYSIDYASLPIGFPNTNTLQDMVTNNNMKLIPVQQTKSYAQASSPTNFDQLGRQWQSYQDIGTDIYKPHKIYVSKGTNAPELRLTYSNYDTYGNMREAFYPLANTRTIYVWGYNGQYLLAEIKNVPSYTSVANATTLSSLIATSDNGTTTETAMQAALNSFRTSLENQYPEAMMTTYVHEPGVGVKIITDEKGYETSFFYDQHNRLLRVEDHNGKLLSENQYNFRVN